MYIHVTVKASTTGTVSNTATVDSTTHDPDLTNNSSAVTTPVDPDADLAIIKTASPEPVVAGDMAKYTLAVAKRPGGRSGGHRHRPPPGRYHNCLDHADSRHVSQ